MIRFSFILPAYKGRYLKEAINSILEQTYPYFELIIVNDKSPDDIDSIVNAFEDNRVSYYVNKENIGGKDLVAQWNHCLSFAKNEYVILATDDDLYENNFLESFIPLIKKYSYVNVFQARIMSIDKDGKILSIEKCYKEYLRPEEYLFHYFNGIKGGIPQNIFKKSALDDIGGFISFPLGWGSDDATILAMSKNGIVHSQNFLARFRWSDINISNNHDNATEIKKFESRLLLTTWLDKYVKGLEFQGGDLGDFFKEEIIGKRAITRKVFIIHSLRHISIFHLPEIYKNLKNCETFKLRDIMSILYNWIKSRI